MQNVSQEHKYYCQVDPRDKQSLFFLVDGEDLTFNTETGLRDRGLYKEPVTNSFICSIRL